MPCPSAPGAARAATRTVSRLKDAVSSGSGVSAALARLPGTSLSSKLLYLSLFVTDYSAWRNRLVEALERELAEVETLG